MSELHLFDRIDHLMIEVDDPQSMYDRLQQEFGLPQAWPLMTSERYTSIGINFGNANIELISFKERFGVSGTRYSGLSGVCLTSERGSEDIHSELGRKHIALLDGEDAPGHQTHVIASKAAPTIFVCHYKFDTSGWQARLAEEFASSNGGTHGVTGIEAVGINNPLLETCEFAFSRPDSAMLLYSKAPQIHLRSANASLKGRTIVVGGTLFAF